jgi:hypothetical protein
MDQTDYSETSLSMYLDGGPGTAHGVREIAKSGHRIRTMMSKDSLAWQGEGF